MGRPLDDDQRHDEIAAPDQTGRRLFLKVSALAGLFALSPTIAAGAATKKTTKTTKKKATTTTPKAPAAAASTSTAVAAAPTAKSGKPFSDAQELEINFSFTPSGGGRINNPYVAVYVEDSAGNLVRTIELNVQLGRGERYINELRRWFEADQTRQLLGGSDVIQTMSSATRQPGAYKVVWDGRDTDKALVAQGAYFLCIESAREHGPYQLIREAITLSGVAFSKTIADNGELTGVAIALRAKG